MVLRWTTFVLGLVIAGVVADVCIVQPLGIACEPTTEIELASTAARGSRLARRIEAPRLGLRELAHDHPLAVPTSFVVAPPIARVAVVTSIAPGCGVDTTTAPDVAARGPPAAHVLLLV